MVSAKQEAIPSDKHSTARMKDLPRIFNITFLRLNCLEMFRDQCLHVNCVQLNYQASTLADRRAYGGFYTLESQLTGILVPPPAPEMIRAARTENVWSLIVRSFQL